ncbi:FAD/NAD(P)-binding protein [Oxalobacteraceae bacterium]|nr:FAD/NAD(P)-binding protein [Oxalobacteraceae bacterium]
MKRFNIVIVGMGQRGLSILERIGAMLDKHPVNAALSIHLIDPAIPGQGIHKSEQPRHLLVNTIAGQVTVYCDASVQDAGPLSDGPTFLEWMRRTGYKSVDGNVVIAANGAEIDENEYVPRTLLGEYFTWVIDQLVENMPDNVTILNHRREAVNVIARDGNRMEVQLQGGFKIDADFVFLTTGHAGCSSDEFDRRFENWVAQGQQRNSHLAYFSAPYPITTLHSISPQATVAICGTGLTSADIVSGLTQGVDGRYEPLGDGRLKYLPSGREPRIVLFSRQGLPSAGRATNQKGIYGQYKSRFFTREFVDATRRQALRERGTRQLDWEHDLLPTVKKEMAYCYHCAETQSWHEAEGYEPSAEHLARVEQIIAPLAGRSFADAQEYDDFMYSFLAADVANSIEGNQRNPEKAAADMLRDIRDFIRYAVDYSGLTPESHRNYLASWCSISNRIASGPPKERNMEMLALIDAGVVTCGLGSHPVMDYDAERAQFRVTSTQFEQPRTEYCDVMIRAKVELLEPETSRSPMIQNMLKSGLAVPYQNGSFKPSGILIDEATNVVNRDGKSVRNLWAMGYIVEGPHFYTYVLPRPFSNSRALQDAGKGVLSMMRQIDARIGADVELAGKAA